MAQPVWVLSVDLQTKTATFQSGMAEAARTARGAFTDIKTGSGEMGREVGGNMAEARHGVMMLGEEFGVHLPRGLVTFISSLGPVGAAMEAAFPFLAIALGATLLIEHLVKLHEESEKLTADQSRFVTATQTAFNVLDEKLLQAGIHADELRNDHLGALKKQLELIDKQSMAELVQQFDAVAKGADVVLDHLQKSWYQFGSGSAGAKHALEEFKTEYASLLAQGKGDEAADLLKGTRERAEYILAMQKQAAATAGNSQPGGDQSAFLAHEAALNALKGTGLSYDKDGLAIQQAVIKALDAQADMQKRVGDVKSKEGANATRSTAGEMAAQQATAAKAAIDSQLRIADLAIQADRAFAAARLAISRASVQERAQSDLDFAQWENDVATAANAQQIDALNKYAADYQAQLRALNEKAEEITQEHTTKVAEITARAQTEQAAKGLSDLQQSEREKIASTREASSERLAAIDAAIAEEQSRQLQDTDFYRGLLTQRADAVRRATEEEAKLQADAGRIVADDSQKMAELMLAAQTEHQQLMDSVLSIGDHARMEHAILTANAEYAIKKMGLEQQIEALDQSGRDYQNKLAQLQAQERQLYREHENAVTAITDKAAQERETRQKTAAATMENNFSQAFLQVLAGHQSFAAMMAHAAESLTSNLISASIDVANGLRSDKLDQAKDAARWGFHWGAQYGGPLAPVLAPTMAATFFAGVMAFEKGGIVPGIGNTDSVPAMLTPGEAVLPKALVERLATGGPAAGGDHYHLHVRPTYHVQALDSTGLDRVLEKNTDTLHRHVSNSLRRMNR